MFFHSCLWPFSSKPAMVRAYSNQVYYNKKARVFARATFYQGGDINLELKA